MVDFNNEATIGTPAVNVVKILLLQARANTIEALESYNIKIMQGVNADQSYIKSRLGTWFLELQAYLNRSMKPKDYEDFYNKVKGLCFFNTKDLSDLEVLYVILELNKIMDKLRITRIDLKANYDKSNIEEDNFYNDLS